jgi:class 3 adenylate cyclase
MYKRFKVNGERYYKLGFSKFLLDEASIDVVRERRLKNRFDQDESYFFLASINPDSKHRVDDKEVLAFINKCNDLILKINEESVGMPEGWPKYFLLYVSSFGFEKGIYAALKSAIIPSESHIKTVDHLGLKDLIRQVKPGTKLPIEHVSEEDIDELRKKDLEYLLRLRLSVSTIIHKKFEKTTTILLADMKDFTRRTAQDSLESAEAVQKMSDILKINVEQYGGWGTNTEGDSFIASFDKPEQALLAAVKSVDELHDYNRDVDEKNRIFVRVGVCTGQVIFKGVRPFIGDTVNVAARIMKDAEANKVITVDDTYKQVSAYRNFQFRNLGTKSFKGIDKPLAIYEVSLKKPTSRNY